MKRYPKHARPLWGAPKRKVWVPTGITLTFGEGNYVRGDTYTFTVKDRPTASMAYSYTVGPTPPRPGVLTFTTDGTTPNANIEPGTVLVLPPVEVRL